MKYLSLFFLFIIYSCSPLMNKQKYVTLSTLDEQRFVFTKEDSILIKKEEEDLEIYLDACKKSNESCFVDITDILPNFKSGVSGFRNIFYERLKISRSAKPSKNRIKILIGKQNSIENIEVTDFKNSSVKNEIIRVLKLPELNKWKSARTLSGNKNYEIIFYLYIKTK
ncbi:hypothetical protein [Halpernia frigidisoli]|uniref:Lipoprotein n=1 Tax=Halpernia frigidisoli TaxID=1125876 RepID=A0A1I3F4K7_9FLAO|nr:hypothetical protein [Halpernia frigidisoli]SFI06103.1 hypothetical protein SAMN05443292_1151 [Halpernia frigidisoli]